MATEVELLAIESVIPRQRHLRARYLKREVGQGENSALQDKVASQSRLDVVGDIARSQLRLALAAQAKFVDAALNVFVREPSAGYFESSFQVQTLLEIIASRRKVELCLQVDGSSHYGRIGAVRQAQQVVNLPGWNRHIELDVVTGWHSRCNDKPRRGERRAEDPCVHGLQIGIAAGAVDDSMKG